MNVASFELCRKGKEVATEGAEEHSKGLGMSGTQVRTREHQYAKQELHPLNFNARDCTV